MIVCEGIQKEFKKDDQTFRVLKNLSLTARDGAVTGLVGPNGAGKTTTFKVLGGIHKAEAGSAHIDGIDVWSEASKARRVLEILPEVPGFIYDLTAREQLWFYAAYWGWGRAQFERELAPLIEQLNLKEFLGQECKNLSRGQAVRISLARSLLRGCKNIVLDEPTVGLDFESAASVRSIVRRLKAQGHCVLISTHIISDIEILCDEIYELKEGQSLRVEKDSWLSEVKKL